MQRILLYLFILFSFPATLAADESVPAGNPYTLITAHQGWLNTSRPLVADDLKGHILLLDFWTYGCINCMHVMPDLAALEETFGDKLTIIGVHSAKFKNERDTGHIRDAILRNHLRHPVVNDFDFAIWKAFGVKAWPTLILISPESIIDKVYTGEGHRDDLVQDINRLVAKYDGSINSKKLPIALEADKQPNSVLRFPTKLAYGTYHDNNALYIADSGHDRIAIAALDGHILATIGNEHGFKDGAVKNAQFNHPQGLLLAYPLLYVADTGNHALRQIDLEQQQVTTLAGTGEQGQDYAVHDKPALKAALSSPWDITFYPDKQHIVITQAGLHQLWSYDIAAKTVTLLAGNGQEALADGAGANSALAQPSGLSPAGDMLYFVDAESSSLRELKNGTVTTLIGSGLFDFGYKDGKKGVGLLQHPLGLAADSKAIIIADAYNHAIRRYDLTTGQLSTLAGGGKSGRDDGAGAQAHFNEPNDVIEADGRLYIADTNNNAIRMMDRDGKKVETLKFIP